MFSVKISLRVPQCKICNAVPLVSDIGMYGDFEPIVVPNGWVLLQGTYPICQDCMDQLRSIFMEEQKPKAARPYEGDPYINRKEEHWLTRNGTRVVVKMPLPAVGRTLTKPEILLRWGQDYNCLEASNIRVGELVQYDLAERLEDSVKKEQS